MSFERDATLKEAFPVPSPREIGLGPEDDLWIFGYGSLMWDPGFPHVEARQASITGFHRSFCVTSYRYRGTAEVPGLVLGLDRGGSCHGMAFRVIPQDQPQTLDYLWDREMISGVYRPEKLDVRLRRPREGSPDSVRALTFVVQRHHDQYVGGLTLEETAAVICRARGQRGACADYLRNTVRHLSAMEIEDAALTQLLEAVERVNGQGTGG